MISKLAEYWKFIIATLTPLFLVVQAAITDSTITTEEWYAIGFAAVVAVGVFLKGNKPPAPEV